MTDAEPDWFPLPVPALGPTAYTELGLRPDATAEEVRVATARRARSLKRAGASQEERAKLNASSLSHTDHRAAHDEEHPPCAILRLEPTWSPLFDDPQAALAWARHDLEIFLRIADDDGHVTDLRRTDFTDDFRHHPLLDRKDIG
jgi:hypothetical protein